MFRSEQNEKGRFVDHGPKWVLIPLVDLRDYADRVGRPFPKMPLGRSLPESKP